MQVAGMRNFRESWVKGSSIYIIKEKFKKEKITARLNLWLSRLSRLSRSHSAQGKVSSEGVVGIARAFLGAGARSVLVALWSIDDEATMEFMRSFYQHLKDGNSASVSLNRAMKCLRESENFNAPRFWAPFVLIGDDVTIDFGEINNESWVAPCIDTMSYLPH